MADIQKDNNYEWRPVSLDHLLSAYKLTDSKVLVPVILWIVIISGSLFATSQLLTQEWLQLTASRVQILNFFMINPALILGILLLFWFGFEWGFIPVYLCTFIIAIHSEMPLGWALVIGLSFVLGLVIIALAYQSLPVSYNLRNFGSIAFFVIISFVSALASSLGSFIWSFFHQLPAHDMLVIWKSWWSGIFFQSLLIVAPLLFLCSPAVERLKAAFLTLQPKGEVSIRWVYGSVISITVTLALFVFGGNMLGKMYIHEIVSSGSQADLPGIMEAISIFELISWTSIGLIVVTGYAGIWLLGSWNSELEWQIGIRTRELEQSEIDLKRSLEEKRILLQEVHHRVKNNLAQVHALLVLQEDTDSKRGTTELLKISRSRIKSMSLAHEALYQSDSLVKIDLRDYMLKIINAIHQSFQTVDKPIELKHKLIETDLEMAKAIPLGLLINEIMINSYKHAFNDKSEGYIDVETVAVDSRLRLTIRDNGSGISHKEKLEKSRSLGMLLIRKFTQQLSAKIDIQSDENGTCYEITMPV